MLNFGPFFIFGQISLQLFFEGETKEIYCVLANFCICYFAKMKRKPVKQKIDKCFPINLSSHTVYQKLGKSEQKIKTVQNPT